MRLLLPALFCFASTYLLGAGSTEASYPSALHPQDGPDADVRIRIEESQVRVNVILNLAFIDEIIEPTREDEYYLHPVEYELLHEELWDYFHDDLRVTIDGVIVQPVDVGFEVAEPDATLLPLFPLSGMKALLKVRLSLQYPAKAAPQRVTILWPAFPPDLVLANPDTGETPPIEITAQLRAGGVDSIVIFKEAEPEYTWHASAETFESRLLAVPEPLAPSGRSIPVLSIALAVVALALGGLGLFSAAGRRHRRVLWLGAPLGLVAAALTLGIGRLELTEGLALPNQNEALSIFQPLHANIYRAFDYSDESDVYDALAQSVHGDLLDRLYNEIYRSLIMQEEGGAVARVEAVNPLETEVGTIGLLPPAGAPGFTIVSRWQVEGAVFHWGHSHRRTNEYQARYNVLATDEGWRIADSQVLEQRRVDAEPIAPGAGPVWPGMEDDEL